MDNENIYSQSNECDENTDIISQDEGQCEAEVQSKTTEKNDIVIETKSTNDDEKNVTDIPSTVTFERVEAKSTKNTTGIKVFFGLIAVVVALVIALVSGFVFGKANYENNGNLNLKKPALNSAQGLVASNVSNVYNNVAKSVVNIYVYNQNKSSEYENTSGLIYSDDGYIITNDHIYANVSSPKFLVTLYDGTEYYAEYVAGDTRSDIAVIKINATGLTPVKFRDSSEIAVGEDVVSIGHNLNSHTATLNKGYIASEPVRKSDSSQSKTSYTLKVLETSMPTATSGGALVDMYSYVIGLTSSRFSTVINGAAIPSNTVVDIADSLIKNGKVTGRGKLGVNYVFVDSVYSDLNKDLVKGMYIDSVSSESSFSKFNVASGDIITHINDVRLTSRDVALDIIESIKPGVSVSFTVYHPKTKTNQVIHTTLLDDPGSSSYTDSVVSPYNPDDEQNNYFDDDADSFKDY